MSATLPRSVPVNSLRPGDRFWVAPDQYDGCGYTLDEWNRMAVKGTTPEEDRIEGRLVQCNVSRASVNLTGVGMQYWAATSMVHLYPAPTEDADSSRSNRHDREPHHMTTEDAKIKATRARYAHQNKQLSEALAMDPPNMEKAEIIQKRIDALLEEGKALGIDLTTEPEPPATEDATTTQAEMTTAEVGTTDAHEDEMAKEQKAAAKKAAAKRGAKTVGGKKVEEGKKVAAAKREKKEKVFRKCIMTGREVLGLFSPGADAKAKSVMYKVERGQMSKAEFAKDHPVLSVLVKFAGSEKSAGNDNSDFRIVQSPVKLPGRGDVKVLTLAESLAILDKAASK